VKWTKLQCRFDKRIEFVNLIGYLKSLVAKILPTWSKLKETQIRKIVIKSFASAAALLQHISRHAIAHSSIMALIVRTGE